MKKNIQEIQEEYELELERIISEIQKQKANQVLLQFPDGMKPHAAEIAQEIESKTKARCAIWLGSCFGACDTPQTGEIKFDLLIQFGHSHFPSKKQCACNTLFFKSGTCF